MKSKAILYSMIICLLFASCEEWLNVNPTDKYSKDTFWTTAVNANAGLMGCYNALYPWRFMMSFETDMLTSNAVAYNEANGTRGMARGQALSTCELVSNSWKRCYAGIGRVNTLIDNIGNVDELSDADKATMTAEAKFLRAFFYGNLVHRFGGVPLITSAPDAAEQESLPRDTKEAVTEQIYKDLDDAIAVLPASWNAANLGRATKGAAQSYKARMLLYDGKWAEAAAMAKQVMDSKTYALFNDYRHFWSESNKHHKEVIFNLESIIPEHTVDYDSQIWQLNRPAPLKELVDIYLCTDGLPIEKSPLYDPEHPYENRDPRLLKSIICIGYPYLGQIMTPSNCVLTGFGSKKYTSYEDNVSQALLTRSAHNFIIIRYAEVLLTYAEAQNEASGPDASVYDAINQLRRRPDIQMPDLEPGLNQAQMREVIRRERRVELCMEGLYYFDILRWKTAEIENNGIVHRYSGEALEERKFNPARDYLWPIPYDQILHNPNLKQNPGWE
ncbi:MAG: RagB/SusD family nutrient uptake outer membrane protein [Bacteroidales bacterium]|nr:RagB/SusD family nutrient uptake outer membrane protein [Bacteroidales bacterium]